MINTDLIPFNKINIHPASFNKCLPVLGISTVDAMLVKCLFILYQNIPYMLSHSNTRLRHTFETFAFLQMAPKIRLYSR